MHQRLFGKHLAKLALFALFLVVMGNLRISAGETMNERDAIAATIDQYIDGGRKGSSEVMKKAFHEGATIHTATYGGPIAMLYELVDSHPPSNDIPYSIANLDIAENIAMARVEIDNWAGTKYTDMFTLVKSDGKWKIVSKVSYKH